MRLVVLVTLLFFLYPPNSWAIANPASEFCISKGNRLEIQKAPDGGSFGQCVLKSGEVCDEWKYFNKECGLDSSFGKGSTSITYALILSFSLGALGFAWELFRRSKKSTQ